jgi:hypothetical protein
MRGDVIHNKSPERTPGIEYVSDDRLVENIASHLASAAESMREGSLYLAGLRNGRATILAEMVRDPMTRLRAHQLAHAMNAVLSGESYRFLVQRDPEDVQ